MKHLVLFKNERPSIWGKPLVLHRSLSYALSRKERSHECIIADANIVICHHAGTGGGGPLHIHAHILDIVGCSVDKCEHAPQNVKDVSRNL